MRNAELASLIGNATRQAFVRIIELCLDEQVDALMLAGDLYDGEQTSMKTATFLAKQLQRLAQAGIQTFIIRGNHDASSRITKELTFPDAVKVFGGRAEAIAVKRAAAEFPVVVHGLSYSHAQVRDSLLGKYRPAVADAANIGLMHTSLGGALGHDDYAPCSISDLQGAGFQYWALGHVHKRMVVEGQCTIVMPGIPQGRDINEAGAKSVTLVTIQDDRSVLLSEHITSIAQFERVSIDVSGVENWRALVEHIGHVLSTVRQGLASEHLVARLHLTGATPLAWRIRRDIDLLSAEADDRASAIGSCWIEKVETSCQAHDATTENCSNPLVELRRLIEDDVVGSDEFLLELTRMAEDLRRKLPTECRDMLGDDEDSFREALALLAREGMEDVLAHLHASEKGGNS